MAINKKLVESIFNKFGKQGVKHVVENNELPAVKLTSEEMNLIKAGMGTYKNFKDVLDELGKSAGIDPDKIKELF